MYSHGEALKYTQTAYITLNSLAPYRGHMNLDFPLN
jgi:hypothetical protein